jgi:hypothetical protein
MNKVATQHVGALNDPGHLGGSLRTAAVLVDWTPNEGCPPLCARRLYGRSISAGDYLIQYNTTFKGLNFHFDEHLNIQAHDGKLIQEIEVWKTQTPDGEKILVYSTIPSKRPIT